MIIMATPDIEGRRLHSHLGIVASEALMGVIVGVDLDYEVLGQANSMLMVSASGAA